MPSSYLIVNCDQNLLQNQFIINFIPSFSFLSAEAGVHFLAIVDYLVHKNISFGSDDGLLLCILYGLNVVLFSVDVVITEAHRRILINQNMRVFCILSLMNEYVVRNLYKLSHFPDAFSFTKYHG